MKELVISLFVLTSLAVMFSEGWNLFAETVLSTWEIKGPDGEPKKPIIQTFVYAIVISLISVFVLFILTHPKLGLVKSTNKH